MECNNANKTFSQKLNLNGQQLYSKHRTTLNHGLLNLRLQTSDLLLQECKLVVLHVSDKKAQKPQQLP